MTPDERSEHYIAAQHAAREEYSEIEKEVKRLGKRLSALRMTLAGLGSLTGIKNDDLFSIGTGTVVVTDESRVRVKK